ncbi:unnamed protein product, partial [marine sediment metagenome]
IKDYLKATDKEATPEEIAKARAMLTAANAMASGVKVTNTETYRNIVLDQPISKEQFVPSKNIDEITEELKNLRAQYIHRLENISPTDPNLKTDVQVKPGSTRPDYSATLPDGVTIEQPTTIRVPEDYPTTYAAVDAAKAGDTIVVSGGLYRGEAVEGKGRSVVQGKVLGPQGEPVKGASVELQIFVGGDVDDMANYRAQRVFTDANGLYVFEGLQTDANGLYVLEGLEAGSAHIGRAFTAEDGSTSGVPYGLMFDFEIEPGKSYDITLGGKG